MICYCYGFCCSDAGEFSDYFKLYLVVPTIVKGGLNLFVVCARDRLCFLLIIREGILSL